LSREAAGLMDSRSSMFRGNIPRAARSEPNRAPAVTTEHLNLVSDDEE
jgi:hypothetical protein